MKFQEEFLSKTSIFGLKTCSRYTFLSNSWD